VEFAIKAQINETFALLLLNRGINDGEDAKRFVHTNARDVGDPFLLEDMERAVERIKQALADKEHVTVYGDYDADGITATVIMLKCLEKLGICADHYIPSRTREGYGLHTGAVKAIKERGTTLIITVDLGITAASEVEYAKKLGIDIIITDHHHPFDKIPSCPVINPKRADDGYPFIGLAGVGVAFKLACALCGYEEMRNYLDLVCLGTVADIVPLLGENRFYVKQGLSSIADTKNLGIASLIKYAGYEGKPINSSAVAFTLTPRINSAGRMGDAETALRLLMTGDGQTADELALQLCETNMRRQDTEQEILNQVISIIESDERYKSDKVLVVAGDGWHPGVIGIVAARLTDRYYKPAVLLTYDGDFAHGSARSIEGFDIFGALCAADLYIEKFGGHTKAAGLTVKRNNIENFTKVINEAADVVLTEELLTPYIMIDCELDPAEATVKFTEKLEYFEPYGEGNPQPVFSMCGVEVIESAPTRDGKHLRMKVKKNGISFICIGFHMGDEKIEAGSLVDVAFNIIINEYKGSKNVNLVLKGVLYG